MIKENKLSITSISLNYISLKKVPYTYYEKQKTIFGLKLRTAIFKY